MDDVFQVPSLTKSVKSLQARLFTLSLLQRTGASSCRQLALYLEEQHKIEDTTAWDHQNPRTWNRHLRGGPIRLGPKVERIERKLPGSTRCLLLLHWKVAKSPITTAKAHRELVGRLPVAIGHRLYRYNEATGQENRRSGEPERAIAALNTWEALGCLLLMSQRIQGDPGSAFGIRHFETALHLVTRLATRDVFGDVLNAYIRNVLMVFYLQLVRDNPDHWDLHRLPPGYEREIGNYAPDIELLCNEQIISNAEALGLVSNKRKNQMRFLFWCDRCGSKREIWHCLSALADHAEYRGFTVEDLKDIFDLFQIGFSSRHPQFSPGRELVDQLYQQPMQIIPAQEDLFEQQA